ncbi:MAG TPA: hypothetical protein VKB76_15685 [Ktedonobacterales bacterium]|nr:hypothetical protein [Ktedonobacterales bacterium]
MYTVSGIQAPEIPTITTRERATAVTVGVVLAIGLLISVLIYCFIQASTALTHVIGDKSMLDSIHQMLFIALFLTPVTVAGGFWLGLWRLSQVTTTQAWLDTMMLGLALFSGTAGALGIEASLLAANGTPSGPLWWIGALFQFPLLIPLNAALGVTCSGAGFLCALLFANWDAARTAAPIDNGRRDFALVGTVASGVSMCSFFLFYLALIGNTSLSSAIADLQSALGAWAIILIITVVGTWLTIPSAIIAAAAGEHAFRVLADLTPIPQGTKIWLRYVCEPETPWEDDKEWSEERLTSDPSALRWRGSLRTS